MLGPTPHLVTVHHLHLHGIDHRDIVGPQIGDIDPLERPLYRWTEAAHVRAPVDIDRRARLAGAAPARAGSQG